MNADASGGDGATSAKRTTSKASEVFTDEEKAAMKDRAQELKAAARRGARSGPATGKKSAAEDGESDVLGKIAEMNDADRALAEQIHAIVKASGLDLTPRLWYGMPAYAKASDVIFFFQPAQKFKTRYATLGFSDKAKLDDGAIWPVYYALTELAAADEARIVTLIKKAVS